MADAAPSDVEAIKALKYRYVRTLDTKDWDGFAECLTPDVTADYSGSANPVRVLAQGRDDMATLDTTFSGKPGFQNDGDNEITGIHVSDGDASIDGLIGAKAPTPFENGWRVFYTRQHGRNVTFEIVRTR